MALAIRCIFVLAVVATSGAQQARVTKSTSQSSGDEFDMLDNAIQQQQTTQSQGSDGSDAPNLLTELSGVGDTAEGAKDLFTFNPDTQSIEAASDQTLPPSLSPTSLTFEPTTSPTGFPTGSPTPKPTPPPTKDVHQVADWFLAPAKAAKASGKPESSLSDIFSRFDKKRKKELSAKRQALKDEAKKESEMKDAQSLAKSKNTGGAFKQYKARKAKEEQLRSFRKTEALRKEANDLLHMSSSNPLLSSMSAKLKAEMADVLGTVSDGNSIAGVKSKQPTVAPTTNSAVIKDWFFKPVNNPNLAVPTFRPTAGAGGYHESAKEMMDKYLMADLKKEHIDVTKLSPALKEKMLGVISDLITKEQKGSMPSANQMWAQTEHVMANDLLVKGDIPSGQAAASTSEAFAKSPEALLAKAKEKALKTEDRLMSDIFASKAGDKVVCDANMAKNADLSQEHQCKLIALAKGKFTIPTEMKQTLHTYLAQPKKPEYAEALSKMKDILDSSLPVNRQVQELQKIVTTAAIYDAVGHAQGHGFVSEKTANIRQEKRLKRKHARQEREELELLGKTITPTAAPTVPAAPIRKVAGWFQSESREIERCLPVMQTLLAGDPGDRLAEMDKFDHAAWFHSKVENALQSQEHVKDQTDWFGHSDTEAKTPSWYIKEKKTGVPAWLKPTNSPTIPPGDYTSAPTVSPTTVDMYDSFKKRAAGGTPVPTPSSWKDEGFLGELKAIEQQRAKIKTTIPGRKPQAAVGPPTPAPSHMDLPPQTKGNMVAWAQALLKRFPDNSLATHNPTARPTVGPTKQTVVPTPAPSMAPSLGPTLSVIPVPKDKYGRTDEQALQKTGYLQAFNKDLDTISSIEKSHQKPGEHKKRSTHHRKKKKAKKMVQKKKKKSGIDITKLPQAPASIYSDDDDAGDDDADDDDKSSTPAQQERKAKQQIIAEFAQSP